MQSLWHHLIRANTLRWPNHVYSFPERNACTKLCSSSSAGGCDCSLSNMLQHTWSKTHSAKYVLNRHYLRFPLFFKYSGDHVRMNKYQGTYVYVCSTEKIIYEKWAIPGCHANIRPILTVQESDSWALTMGRIGCPETSVRNYHYSLRNNPDKRGSHKLRGGITQDYLCSQIVSIIYKVVLISP